MADHSHDHAPGLPTVEDEAGDSPVWLPIVGIVLLLAILLTAVARSAMAGDENGAAALAPAAVEAPAAD